ncbi:MAG: acetone carboxylase subunit gamma [Gammaproteobacteria bacterium]|jgi:acetophenone carboxylase|nr:acetone carboxylase subunit gamma [Gammaproteobacteria bacterium]HJP35638.1 acetone carboxylase subunit gamma [Gammaproteobacteria bacterium]
MNTTFEKLRVTESLDLDLNDEQWLCNRCGEKLGPAQANYKDGCKVYERDPTEVHEPKIEGEFTFAPDPAWVRIIEFYCPTCAVQIETEYLPPGHPITHDIEIDIARLKQRLQRGDIVIVDGRITNADEPGSVT